MRRSINQAVLTSLREMTTEDALRLLAIHCKADPTFHPVKQMNTRRWHALTTVGEFEILTTGVKWLDTRANKGGGGAIDLAMHVLELSFVNAVKALVARRHRHG